MVETWRSAHSFTLLPLEGESRSHVPLAVFTSGPIAADLAALAQPTPELVAHLGRSLGLEWVTSLVGIDRPSGLEEARLTRYLREHFGLRPGSAASSLAVRSGRFVRQRQKAVPAELLADFVATEYGRLDWMGQTIRPLVKPLVAAASGRGWHVGGQPERARDLFNALAPSLTLRRLSGPANERPISGFEFPDLYARALLEIIELYDDRPRLRICRHCRRLFVAQRKGQQSCRRYVWLWRGRDAIGGCMFDRASSPLRVEIDAQARRREYTRLQMRVSRNMKALGPDNPRTQRVMKEFDEWKTSNPAPRGRRPNPIAPEFVPGDWRGRLQPEERRVASTRPS
jgi:hypothetical protein